MALTLYEHLIKKAPPFTVLQDKYNPLLQLVDVLIGTIPNCDLVMEIWPTSFQTYNLFVPNLLNLPISLLKKQSVKQMMGLAMYQSSASSGCSYCTAHCCSFALRRGVEESVILGEYGEKEAAVIKFSRKMGQIPCSLTDEDIENIKRHCSSEEIEYLSMGIVLMGFLNKFMDVAGVALEQEAMDDVAGLLENTGWKSGKHFNGSFTPAPVGTARKDTLKTYIKVALQAPGAIRLEKQWLKDVPNDKKGIRSFLKDNIGHYFSILSKLKRVKLQQVWAVILCNNFNEKNTFIGLHAKIVSGLIFSIVVENDCLEREIKALAKSNQIEISAELHQALIALSRDEALRLDDLGRNIEHLSFSHQQVIMAVFAKKASASPAYIDELIINELVSVFSAEAIVEMITWLSILQALHRLEKLPAI